MALVAFEKLTFSYPGADAPALRAVSLEVEAGEYLLVAGCSGSGKTTLLRHLKSALAPRGSREGRVLLAGRPLDEADAAEQARRIGYVMQNPHDQIVADTVAGEMAFGLESLGWPPERARLRIAETASFFGLAPWLHRSTAELSGGQKQLLNLAAVMAADPEVLVLDEPTAQLDPIAAEEFLTMVRKLNDELGVTVVMGEQRLEGAFATADRVAVLEEGSLAALGEPRAVAAELYAAASPLARALPAPVRIFHEVAGSADGAPLTVRAGRRWLAEWRELTGGECREALPSAGSRRGAGEAPPSAGFRRRAGEGLVLRDLWFRYRREEADVLRGLSLEVPRGSLVALLGDNGAGKSTALRAAAGLVRPYRGAVTWEGRRRQRGAAPVTALLPQDPQLLFSRATVREELDEMGRAAEGQGNGGGCDGGTLDGRDVVELCALGPLLSRHPLDLSGGEQQRVALAKVLLAGAPVLLLDEPTKGVDALFKDQLAELLAQLTAEGRTVLLASHDVEFCARHADRCALIFEGACVACDEPRRFFARNRLYTTAASRMSRGIFEATVTAEQVAAACAALAASRPGMGEIPGANVIPGVGVPCRSIAPGAGTSHRPVDSQEAS